MDAIEQAVERKHIQEMAALEHAASQFRAEVDGATVVQATLVRNVCGRRWYVCTQWEKVSRLYRVWRDGNGWQARRVDLRSSSVA